MKKNIKKLENDLLYFLIFIFVLCACARLSLQNISPPVRAEVTSDEFEKLYGEYLKQIDGHKNDIQVQINPIKTQFSPDEQIIFTVVITNKINKNVVIRRQDAEIDRDIPSATTPMFFSIVPADPSTTLIYPGLGNNVTERLSIPSKDFIVLRPGKSYSVNMPVIPKPKGPVPTGAYSVSATYKNYTPGAIPDKDDNVYLIDYGAWMGEITSNEVNFTVVPQL